MDDVLALNPGELRETISFYTSTAQDDGAGGFEGRVETLAFSMLCMVNPKGSVRAYEGNKTEYVEVWDLLMRYETGRVPTTSMLAKYNGNTFTILGIENVKARNLVLKVKIARK